MASRIPAHVNPHMLMWVRTQAGYSVEDAANEIGMPTKRLEAWEKNEEQPTLRQAEALAKLYDFSYSIFSLPSPPSVAPVASEYRRLPGIKQGEEPPALRKTVRRLSRRRRLALHLSHELDGKAPTFDMRASLKEQPEDLAGRLREALGVAPSVILEWASEFVAFRAWRKSVENLGVLVCQFSGGPLPDIRGTSILQFPLPIAAVSSKELPLSKSFTLLHELVHLSLAAAAEEAPAKDEHRSDKDWLEVERYCEAVASAILLPLELIRQERDLAVAASGNDVEAIRRIARRFKATPTAIATRLLWLGIMSPVDYNKWKALWKSYCDAHPAKAGFGIATPAEKAVTRAGPYFTTLVLAALSSERITAPDASNYLGVSYEHVEELRKGWATPAFTKG